MSKKILVTTTSFLDTPGPHIDALALRGYDIVRSRGPLRDQELLTLVKEKGPFDGYIVGEDEFSREVLESIVPRAQVISRYGVGLDKIDMETAERLGICVRNTPGVNHTTVTELTFGLVLSLCRQIPEHNALVHKAQWRRATGIELWGKNFGIFGFGRVGKEVARRALSFGMNVLIYNTSWSAEHQDFLDSLNQFSRSPVFLDEKVSARRCVKPEELLLDADVITIHMSLTKSNAKFFNARRLALCKPGLVLVNVSRGALVDQQAVADSIRAGHLGGYGADVVDPEPITQDNPLLNVPKVVLTPHIGSRTTDSVVRQGLAAVNNLIEAFERVAAEV
jgi:D-3-phosphoglycerate dehydrogenase / 2-oxoglutarate reductase